MQKQRPHTPRLHICSLLVAMTFLAGITACGTSQPTTSSTTASATGAGPSASSTPTTSSTDWLTYHRDAARTGDDPNEPSFSSLGAAWRSNLDGAVWAEPLVDGASVIVVTENDSVFAISASSGVRQWRASLGTPRTSNFPCGDIMPLGITGTPVIDGGFLYVVAETEQAGTYGFRLAKLNPADGTIVFNADITPRGMDTNTEQQRSALTVSDGHVVVAWGGLDGDCGSYHGYVETVSEATGAELAQWHDTAIDNQGGIWAVSGPAVDASGNIYVSTGNGSSSDTAAYDYGDSIVKLSPALAVLSFFAPGPPQTWASLNADDNDLGSIGPSLLPNGLLFAIGKGGRGYLLSQASLPSNADPGGGENAGGQVCNATSAAAFSGMAAMGSTIYVPCADGIAAVRIDSATAYTRIWYSTAGSSAPIVAGGLVWTVAVFGGSSLYGLDPSSGAVAEQLDLGATTEHFVTPAAGDGRLFIAAGSTVIAFAPH